MIGAYFSNALLSTSVTDVTSSSASTVASTLAPLTLASLALCSSFSQDTRTIQHMASLSSPSSHTHAHPFNGPLSRTTRVSRYQKGKTNLDFTEARDSEWQWHQLGHMQVCTLLQTDNHANTSSLSFYRPDALPAAQPTASKHWRHHRHHHHYVDILVSPLQNRKSQLHGIYFVSAAVAIDSSHVSVPSSASWSSFSPPSNFVNGHASTMWFTVCRWPQSQEGDWVRPHLRKLHG